MNKEKLVKAVRDCNLRIRDWSGGGELVFAVYEADDSYLGSVTVSGEVLVATRWFKKDLPTFQRLNAVFEAGR